MARKNGKASPTPDGTGTVLQRWEVALAAAGEVAPLIRSLRATLHTQQDKWPMQRLYLDRMDALVGAICMTADSQEDIQAIAGRLTWPHHVSGIAGTEA